VIPGVGCQFCSITKSFSEMQDKVASITFAIFLLMCTCSVFAWNEWNYKVTWNEDEEQVASSQIVWEAIWNKENPPGSRRGHSLHLMTTDTRSVYGGNTYVVLFGGRDNDQKAEHIPRTYDVQEVNGTIVFTTYDEKPVNPCNDPDNLYYTIDEQTNCNLSSAGLVDIGLVYNDVWAYKLCNATSDPPERGFDTACEDSGWVSLHPGALQGGCTIQLGIEVCTVPSERYNHGSVMFDDGTLYVYGGFSQRCEDYCDDLWFFDVYLRGWRQVYAAGQLTNFYTDTLFGVTVNVDPAKVPVDNTSSAFAGPGRRWRHSMVGAKAFTDPVDGLRKQSMAVYGGHRLWHGYSQENNEDNNWEDYLTRPIGGYLDDLWIYTKYLDDSFPGQTFKTNNGEWEKKEPIEQCFSTPGVAWEDRFDITCTIVKPTGRAGHGSAYDTERNRVWIFGGYTTYYPYLRTDGAGSGPGVTSVGSGGFIPYPGYDYFRNDLWYYDLNTSLWIELIPQEDSAVPDARMDPIFLLLGDLIFLHGGFADNYIYSDTWYFNITSSRWLQKTAFVRPIYPPNCTDDFVYIAENNCTELTWPKHLKRDEFYPFDLVPYVDQEYYWPDNTHGPYFGIFDRDFSSSSTILNRELQYSDTAPPGSPLPPFAATGLMQYAQSFSYSFNDTHNATLYERCTSVFAEPTRGKTTDGLYGRAPAPVLIAQPRPQKPGWDGCRDRFDGRTDLPAGLQYVQPLPRYSHRAVFYEPTSEIIMYGGLAYTAEQPKSLENTWEFSTLSDMWYYHLFHCVNNCSSHGDCYFGFCQCHVGYYGVDCSNISCPGTFCYYDENTNLQNCTHACQAGYQHSDDGTDVYVQDTYKIPCTRENWGESNGICDGYGKTMCAPPFVGDDCGTRDCKSNCSFNGWCSIEYPVSRCLCIPGYFGEICEKKLCLNNCSYPNGECNTTSGTCDCNMMYSPYNNTREYKPWGGEDCSYHFPYAAGSSGGTLSVSIWFLVFLVTCMLLTQHSSSNSTTTSRIDASVSHSVHSTSMLGAIVSSDNHRSSSTYDSLDGEITVGT